MQHRYAGDVGDFGKLALLRALASGRRLGVCWYLCEPRSNEPDGDGRHTSYLREPKRFRHLAPQVFDALRGLGERNVPSLEALALLADATYHAVPVPTERAARLLWFASLLRAVERCDLVFTDADNGFETAEFTPKSLLWAEIRALRRPSRALLLYHHQTRFKGGAAAEYAHYATLLRTHGATHVEAVRLRPYSSRFYFLVDADAALSQRFREFGRQWAREAELFG